MLLTDNAEVKLVDFGVSAQLDRTIGRRLKVLLRLNFYATSQEHLYWDTLLDGPRGDCV